MADEKNTEKEPEIVEEVDEMETEDIDEEGVEFAWKDKLKDLREKLSQCEEEKRKHQEDLQRAKADFLNSKRRLEEQFARDRERAADSVILELLSLVDSFDGAMADREAWDKVDERWRKGMESIQAKLLSILKGNNIEEINPIGEAFNPEEHEAVSEVTVKEEKDAHKVISVLQKGFKRGDTIIRPARVVVGAM